MNGFLKGKTRIFSAALAAAAIPLCCFTACKKEVNYFDSVSEIRNNILLAEDGEFSLTVYTVIREVPYAADGFKRETSPRTEIRLIAPTGGEDYNVYFDYGEKSYGGDMSFDNIKAEYFYACTLDCSPVRELAVKITQGETQKELTAKSVLTDSTLSPENIWAKAETAEAETLRSMTDDNGFAGEIYIRLLYEDAPYYYVGIISQEGTTHALLMDGQSGKILARRESDKTIQPR